MLNKQLLSFFFTFLLTFSPHFVNDARAQTGTPTPSPTTEWEPLYKSPTPAPTENMVCPPGGLPSDWLTVTPDTSWMLDCGNCLRTATAIARPTSTQWLPGGDMTATAEAGGTSTPIPEPTSTITPTATPLPEEITLHEAFVHWGSFQSGSGNVVCDVAFGYDAETITCDYEFDGYEDSRFYNGFAEFKLKFTGDSIPIYWRVTELVTSYAGHPWEFIAEYQGNGVGMSGSDNTYPASSFNMFVVKKSYAWTDPGWKGAAHAEARICMSTTILGCWEDDIPTPTPTPEPGKCGEIGGNSEQPGGGIPELPPIMVGELKCVGIPAFGIDLTVLGLPLLEFDGMELCAREMVLPTLEFVGVAVDMNYLAYIVGAVAILRIFTRS